MTRTLTRGAIALITSVGLTGASSAGPSFDCHTNRDLAEQVICGNDDLGQLDVEMSNLYFRITNDSSGRYYRRLKLDQRQWLIERNECGANVRCLRNMYNARIGEFERALNY